MKLTIMSDSYEHVFTSCCMTKHTLKFAYVCIYNKNGNFEIILIYDLTWNDMLKFKCLLYPLI